MPPIGGALITIEQYMVIFDLASVSDYNQWLYASYGVSDLIERFCNFSWRDTGTSVPYGLVNITAMMIRDQISYFKNELNASKKSESIKNYSYTLGDSVAIGSPLNQYQQSLYPYKVFGFGFYALSAQNCGWYDQY
jgi:hypothetical protein